MSPIVRRKTHTQSPESGDIISYRHAGVNVDMELCHPLQVFLSKQGGAGSKVRQSSMVAANSEILTKGG